MIERKKRVFVVFLIFAILSALFLLRLVGLQLINGENYLSQSQSTVIRRVSVAAPRGEILDRNFTPIVTNRSSLDVTINTNLTKDINEEILNLLKIFKNHDQSYNDTFPISEKRPYVFDTDMYESESKRASFDTYLKTAKTSTSSTAEEVIEKLIKYYSLEKYKIEDARDIIAIRYQLYKYADYSYYTFAEDISLETAVDIKENSDILPGIFIDESPVRYYTNEYFASHIIGYTGRIFAEEASYYLSQNYSLNDIVGKEGIEKVYESYLKGQDGYRYTVVDKTGKTVNVIENVDPQIGNDVILTIDTNMQMITESSLADIISQLKEQNGDDAATSGAAVFMEIKTGEILSMTSYPTYNLGTYNADFAVNSINEFKPFLNRAIAGTFPIGSAFKMVAGVGGLEEGIIDPTSTYLCTGKYTHYVDYQPVCFNSRAHGNVTLAGALKYSCNVFFYDVARQLGIDILNSYAKRLGFGSKTGIELYGEQPGVVAGREFRESQGKKWEASEILTAAIGQSDNAATPLQLCNYIATIANYGKRLEPHIVKSIRNNQTGEIVYETQPVVVEDNPIKESTVAAIIDGLVQSTKQGGTSYSGFNGFDICQVAVKTGTAEMTSGQPTAIMVGVAPASDPKIAFVVLVEHGGLSASSILAQTVKDVLTYYFEGFEKTDIIQSEGQLIK